MKKTLLVLMMSTMSLMHGGEGRYMIGIDGGRDYEGPKKVKRTNETFFSSEFDEGRKIISRFYDNKRNLIKTIVFGEI